MANTENNQKEFSDLGLFKKIKCIEIMGKKVCEIKFTEGRITLLKEELNKICKAK